MWHLRNKQKLFKLKHIFIRRLVQGPERIIAIRREDNSVWERRAPLAPYHIKILKKSGIRVIVQPSNRRAYPMKEYADHGAIIQEDISEASLIIGVKQVPVDLLIPNKTYAFFSHTIKAQEANMPLLDAILEKNIRIIDYEKMVDNKGQRVVAFGKYAGVAGMINILHGLGLRLLALGHHTPFMHIGPAHNYRNSGMARNAIRDAGYEIALGLMPKSIGPLTFVFTGSGNVSQGAQEMFQELPYEYVEPIHIQKVAEHGALNKVYGTVVSRDDHLIHKGGSSFDADEYEKQPERYVSNFSMKIAPYATCIVNGIYWDVNNPKLITIPNAKTLLQPALTPWLPSSEGCPKLPHRLLAICDISADPGGSIEFMAECTTIDKPFCLYDADQHTNTESFAGPGVLVCSIDNMPAQLPLEATDFFGSLLLPYIYEMIKSDAMKPFGEMQISPVVKNAVIASNGKLTPNFEYISTLRQLNRTRKMAHSDALSADKKVLVLGAGYVSAPLVDYLSRDPKVSITVASALKDEADMLAKKFHNTNSIVIDVERKKDTLDKLLKEHNIVVSLLPYGLHSTIAEMCIKNHVNMVTASYLNPEMKALHNAAEQAGITIINEVGLDPGIDHFLAMECFDDVKTHGGQITSFISWCGGLPAPEDSENPLRYKFSWSPRGVLLNTIGPAKYLKDGKIEEISAGGALMDNLMEIDFLPGFNLEGFPNRDSLQYADAYGIHFAKSLMRGTLRYKGFCNAIKGLQKLGLINNENHPSLHPKGPDITWKQVICTLLNQESDILLDSLKSIILDKIEDVSRVEAIDKLGLLSDELVVKLNSPLNTLCHYLNKRLAYADGERDLVVLRHDIGVQWPDMKTEMRRINFVVYGEVDGYTAMAKTVGLPAAIATKMILEGEIQNKGMVLPLSRDIYLPLLKRLKQEGIQAVEHVDILSSGRHVEKPSIY